MSEFYKGSLLRLKINTKTIIHEVECELDLNREMKELGSKDIEGVSRTPGKKDFSITGKAIAKNSDGAQEDMVTISTAWNNGTEIDVSLADGVTGNLAVTGKAFIQNVKINSKDEEVVDYSFTIVGNGSPGIGTTTA